MGSPRSRPCRCRPCAAFCYHLVGWGRGAGLGELPSGFPGVGHPGYQGMCTKDPAGHFCPPVKLFCFLARCCRNSNRVLLLWGFSTTEFIKTLSYGRRRGRVYPRFRSTTPASGATQQRHASLRGCGSCWKSGCCAHPPASLSSSPAPCKALGDDSPSRDKS